MTKIAVLMLGFLSLSNAFAQSHCFIATENNQVIQEMGDCHTRRSPCSTFKIALSVMGYNEGVFINESEPRWEFKPGYVDFVDSWKQPHTPATWMQNSVVWYSQQLTQKMGYQKLQDYVRKFNYGNQDVSGDKDKNNGLTQSWLFSSLQISPREQVEFLAKLLENKLPVQEQAKIYTKNILYRETLSNGWKLYAKTGGGYSANEYGGQSAQLWLVGWIEKDKRSIIFAQFIEEPPTEDISMHHYLDRRDRSRMHAIEKLLKLTV